MGRRGQRSKTGLEGLIEVVVILGFLGATQVVKAVSKSSKTKVKTQLKPSTPSLFTTKKSKEAIEMARRKAEGLEFKNINDIFKKYQMPKQEYIKSDEMKRRELEALKLKDIFRKN